jgi:hypothetical protein
VSISLIGMEITMTNMGEHRANLDNVPADETKTKFGSKQYLGLVHATVRLRRRISEFYLAFWPYLD